GVQSLDFGSNGFFHVPIAIVIYWIVIEQFFIRADQANISRRRYIDILVAVGTTFIPDFQRMLVVTVDAVVKAPDMLEAPAVFIAFILVGSLRFRTKEGSARREVMRVAEVQLVRYFMRPYTRPGNRRVDADGRLAPLMAVQTQVAFRALAE